MLVHSRCRWLVSKVDPGIGYELPWWRLSCFLGVIPEPRLDFLSLGNFRLGLTRIELGLNLDLSSVDRTFMVLLLGLLLGPAHHEAGEGLILHEEVVFGHQVSWHFFIRIHFIYSNIERSEGSRPTLQVRQRNVSRNTLVWRVRRQKVDIAIVTLAFG